MPVLTGSDIPADNTVAAFTRSAVIGIADYARSLGGGQPADAVLRDAAAPPADPLLDLTLPQSVRAWLKPAADALGLIIEDGDARDKYGRLQRRVTYLTNNGDVRRTLLHIPPKMLTDPNAYASLGMVMYAIEKNAFVAVFAQDLMAPAPVNANVIDDLWKKERPMDSRFIPWSFVSELPLLDLLDQVEFMRTRLGLEALKPRSPAAPATPATPVSPAVPVSTAGAGTASGVGKVTTDEVGRIVEILSLAGFDDARARKVLLTQAGLGAFAGEVNLEGATNDVGVDLIWKLIRYKDSVPPGNATAFGALLRGVIARPDLPPADANWLNDLITRCAL